MLGGIFLLVAIKVAVAFVFAVVQALKGPPYAASDQLTLQQLRDLKRLEAIDSKMLFVLGALLFVPLWLMGTLDAPRWLAIVWLAAWWLFYARWAVVILRYERSILTDDWSWRRPSVAARF